MQMQYRQRLEQPFPPWWRWGRPVDFWLRHVELVENVIQENELQPLAPEHLPWNAAMMPQREMAALAKTEAAGKKWWPIPFPGGIRIAHLHFKDDVYLLKDEQWAKVSSQIMDQFREKLRGANRVTFEQMMDLSEVLDTMV
jgi:hypothetical protein